MKHSIPFVVQEIESFSFHPLITAEIEGRSISLILDTGASRTVIDSSLTEHFSVIENQNQETFAAGINAQKMQVEQVKIPTIKIGNIEFSNLLAFSTDLSPVSALYEQMVGLKIEGLLGCDFLEKHKAIIDFEKRVIEINIRSTQKSN
jgi:predicted aspartyl protease